jgi:hypothetical protein
MIFWSKVFSKNAWVMSWSSSDAIGESVAFFIVPFTPRSVLISSFMRSIDADWADTRKGEINTQYLGNLFCGSMGPSVMAWFCLEWQVRSREELKGPTRFQRLYWASKSETSYLFNFLVVSKSLKLEACHWFLFICDSWLPSW